MDPVHPVRLPGANRSDAGRHRERLQRRQGAEGAV